MKRKILNFTNVNCKSRHTSKNKTTYLLFIIKLIPGFISQKSVSAYSYSLKHRVRMTYATKPDGARTKKNIWGFRCDAFGMLTLLGCCHCMLVTDVSGQCITPIFKGHDVHEDGTDRLSQKSVINQPTVATTRNSEHLSVVTVYGSLHTESTCLTQCPRHATLHGTIGPATSSMTFTQERGCTDVLNFRILHWG